MSDDRKTDASPQSTWGATPEAKATWERKHGPAARKAAKARETAVEDEK